MTTRSKNETGKRRTKSGSEELGKRVGAAKSAAEAARGALRAAKNVYRVARKAFKEAKRTAKDAEKEAKRLAKEFKHAVKEEKAATPRSKAASTPKPKRPARRTKSTKARPSAAAENLSARDSMNADVPDAESVENLGNDEQP